MSSPSYKGERLCSTIHRNITIVAGETIKKKYNSILDMLKRERLTFSNQLESLESQIRKQGLNPNRKMSAWTSKFPQNLFLMHP